LTIFRALKQSFYSTQSPYDILGVGRFDSAVKIKQAYHKLAMQYHPDLIGENDKIVAINTAYAALRQMKRV
jgi:curved DNA-binding protein CbpA